MHFHVPFHPHFQPFQRRPIVDITVMGNLVLILLGLLVAVLFGPIHLE